jgi:hypothetical protein
VARVRFSNWMKSTTSIAGGGLELEQCVCGLACLLDSVAEGEAEILLDQSGVETKFYGIGHFHY